MEASGFYSAARRFGTAELIQSMKVISDHAESPVDQLDGASITRALEEALPSVLEAAEPPARALCGRAGRRGGRRVWLRGGCSLRRVSKTQQRRLETVARRLLALGAEEPSAELLARPADSRALLAALESYVDDLSVRPVETSP